MDVKQFANIVSLINVFWKGESINTDIEKRLWFEEMKDFDYEKTQAALKLLVKTAEYRPNIAKITKTIEDMDKPKVPTALEAWYELRKVLSPYAKTETIQALPKPILEACRSAGGFSNLARMTEDAAQRAFTNAYKVVTNQVEKDGTLKLAPVYLGIGYEED